MDSTRNLTYFLESLAGADESQIEDGTIEIFGESEGGQEGSVEVPIAGLAGEACARILELEDQLNWFLSKVGVDESGVYFAAGVTAIHISAPPKHTSNLIQNNRHLSL